MGCWVFFRGSKNQKSGKCHELPRKSIKKTIKKERWGWGGHFRGPKIKSGKCHELPRKSIIFLNLKTRWGWGGVEVLGVKKSKVREMS